jgi:hypothetical protein
LGSMNTSMRCRSPLTCGWMMGRSAGDRSRRVSVERRRTWDAKPALSLLSLLLLLLSSLLLSLPPPFFFPLRGRLARSCDAGRRCVRDGRARWG